MIFGLVIFIAYVRIDLSYPSMDFISLLHKERTYIRSVLRRVFIGFSQNLNFSNFSKNIDFRTVIINWVWTELSRPWLYLNWFCFPFRYRSTIWTVHWGVTFELVNKMENYLCSHKAWRVLGQNASRWKALSTKSPPILQGRRKAGFWPFTGLEMSQQCFDVFRWYLNLIFYAFKCQLLLKRTVHVSPYIHLFELKTKQEHPKITLDFKSKHTIQHTCVIDYFVLRTLSSTTHLQRVLVNSLKLNSPKWFWSTRKVSMVNSPNSYG